MATESFPELLRRFVAEHYGNQAALAGALDLSPSFVSKAVRGEPNTKFDVGACLKLSADTGEDASTILRAAGKAREADLIESLYGKNRAQLLGADERQLLDMWRAIAPSDRESLRHLLETIAAQKIKARRKTA